MRISLISLIYLFAVCLNLNSPSQAQSSVQDWKACRDAVGTDAITACTRILGSVQLSDADKSVALYSRGQAYDKLHDWSHAIQDYDLAFRLDSHNHAALVATGNALLSIGEHDRNIAVQSQLIALSPDDSRAYMRRGLSYKQTKRFEAALLDFNKSLALDPSNVPSWIFRGNLHWATGEIDKALDDFREGLRRDPNYAFGLERRGLLYLCLDRPGEAESDFTAALKLHPQLNYMLELYIAESKLGQNASQNLRERASAIQSTGKYKTLVDYYLGTVSVDQILAEVFSSNESLARQDRTDEYFWIAERALTHANPGTARSYFYKAVQIDATGAGSYDAALLELKKLSTLPAKDSQTRSFRVNPDLSPGQMHKGHYYALLIGINNYRTPLPTLKTPRNDVHEMATILEKQYGFTIQSLIDDEATRSNILEAIMKYRINLKEEDSLLIYYAGHGYADHEADKAYWLPIDADSAFSSNRIIADDLTVGVRVQTARHVLVISDSCYSGGLSRDVGVLEHHQEQAFLQKMMTGRSRTLMASGGDEPVSDGGGNGHSIFANAIIQALASNGNKMFTASDLFYRSIREQVAGRSSQVPQYSIIRNSDHDTGDFVFTLVQ